MTEQKRRVVFHRSWTLPVGGTSGGQLKVRDAFEHFKTSDRFAPYVYFGEETIWFDNPGNYWLPYKDQALKEWNILPSDVLFFAGKDWKILPHETAASPPVPILNIAQPRHTRPHDVRHYALKYPAIRIAKSSLGKKILEDFGVNGPVHLIPDAIDFSLLPKPNTNPDLDLLIVGLKNKVLAKKLYRRLARKNFWRSKKWKIEVQLPPKLPTRQDYLDLASRAKSIVFIPLPPEKGSEGFYLPALEAMVMEKFVVCPPAVGNVDFCLSDKTCLKPDYNLEALVAASLQALKMSDEEKDPFIKAGREIANNHDIKEERVKLVELLHNADEIWKDTTLFKDR